ncbi:FAD-dependent oxidoreductase [Aphanothece hegewaldii CCALA 016]|uniref:FAD-dependent oxidoreductase n=1 Tax=Aphanothece hegewaldii CCALA 016 TaxID=2107694 RepID=A0A2T1LW29_9CHRO|nr:FAD-binding oxidoreductase [Aphanothece hegewaldii]PSF36114.1 FAD-dependent oxidoreductase [Aphanothece hegewaldii CCALA 016]
MYDFIIVGGGITGSALAYELAKKNSKVLLLEKDAISDNATRYSYGGLAYWSGITPINRQLCREGIEIHRNLSDELGSDTEFRELDLILYIPRETNPETVLKNYNKFEIEPKFLSVQEACEIEPLLNPDAISGVLKLPHGHINTEKTNQAYLNAFCRLGGKIQYEQVTQFIEKEQTIIGIETLENKYYAYKVIICAGGLTRSLLKQIGINIKIYFSNAQVIVTKPTDIKLKTLVMPAILKRLEIENKVTQAENENRWINPNTDILDGICEAGAIQFIDNHLCLGQISQFITDPYQKVDLIKSEEEIRQEIGQILPALKDIPGRLHQCLVAFSNNTQPLVGKIEEWTGLYTFSGFTSTLVFAPPLARHFGNWLIEGNDSIITQLEPIQSYK